MIEDRVDKALDCLTIRVHFITAILSVSYVLIIFPLINTEHEVFTVYNIGNKKPFIIKRDYLMFLFEVEHSMEIYLRSKIVK